MKGKLSITICMVFCLIMTCGIASAANGITLKTDKSAYNLGEPVSITYKNEGKETEVVPYGFQILDDQGSNIYSPNVLMSMLVLQPDESVEFTWDQTDAKGTAVKPGSYTISTSWGTTTIKILDTTTQSSKVKKDLKNIPEPRPVSIFA